MTPMLEDVAPTLATACAALPPEGVGFALGRPGGETAAPVYAVPTLATAWAALPPEGVRFALGRPGGETVVPKLALAHAWRRCQALGRVKVWMP